MKTLLLFLFSLATSIVVSAQDPAKLAPQNYKVLFENDQIRVIEYRLKPGEKEPMHSHLYGVFVYFLSDAKIRTTFPDGKTSLQKGWRHGLARSSNTRWGEHRGRRSSRSADRTTKIKR